MAKKGYLVLENGMVFEGWSFGSEKEISGEIVFNTGMVGYVESFTDPSYFGQIITMTYPLIGNYGVPSKKKDGKIYKSWESEKIQIRGLVVSSYEEGSTHWQSERILSDWLKGEGIPAVSGVDTRILTKTIRERGVMKAILTFKKPRQSGLSFYDINKDNLASFVSCKKPVIYGKNKLCFLLLDCGVKLNQIRILLEKRVKVIRVPWDYNPFESLNTFSFDAIIISNGPGDPKMAKETIETVKEAILRRVPILGICLGNQILALSAGADTYKLKYGHRGQNQPVKDELTGKCFITSQNHGFAVDTKTFPSGWQAWFTNLNDFTNEGIRHKKMPFFSTQFHPEAAPGPTDTEWIFDYFIDKVEKWKEKHPSTA